jgi:hypothetical protein
MLITRKIRFFLIVTVILALSSELEAISINIDSYEFEFLKPTPNETQNSESFSVCSSRGLTDLNELRPWVFDMAIDSLHNEVETMSIGTYESNCDINPGNCALMTSLEISQPTSVAATVWSAGKSNENPAATSLLLLILGLLGISRLRGRSVK